MGIKCIFGYTLAVVSLGCSEPEPSVVAVSYWLRSVGFGSVLSQKPRFRFGFMILSGQHRQQGLLTIPTEATEKSLFMS